MVSGELRVWQCGLPLHDAHVAITKAAADG